MGLYALKARLICGIVAKYLSAIDKSILTNSQFL